MTTIYSGTPVHFLTGKSPAVCFALTESAKAAGLPFPTKAHDGDAGFDLRALFDAHPDPIPAMDEYWIDTGVMVAIPEGYCGLIRERSSWARAGLVITGGVIDSTYRGSIRVVCSGFYDAHRTLARGEAFPRFAQLLIVPIWGGDVEYVDSLDDAHSSRGNRVSRRGLRRRSTRKQASSPASAICRMAGNWCLWRKRNAARGQDRS